MIEIGGEMNEESGQLYDQARVSFTGNRRDGCHSHNPDKEYFREGR